MIIMILGMHRSGTSTIAGVMHMNKIIMGTYQNFWPRPLLQNPKGFYENYDFRKINDDLLKKSSYDVKSYKTDIPEIQVSTRLQGKIKKLIIESNKLYDDWGWKDPRTCLTAIHWVDMIRELGLIDNLKIIFVIRKASSVARSLNKRNNLPYVQGMKLWKHYNKRAYKFSINSKLPTFYCSFEDLLDNPKSLCRNLFQFLHKKEWNPSIIEKFIDKSISKSARGDKIEYSLEIKDLEKEMYSRINNQL